MEMAELQKEKIELKIPHVIKYMGSKKKILTNVVDTLFEIHDGEPICDLFAGSSVLSGALRNNAEVWSNDIQEYSSILSNLYLSSYQWKKHANIEDDILKVATAYIEDFRKKYPKVKFTYKPDMSMEKFHALEKAQQDLIKKDFSKVTHHLFIKNYSGTYWSFEQCLWIDALRFAAEKYKKDPVFYPVMASLMFAMSYNSQSTGHYAQYRDATSESSMKDIFIYRIKAIWPYFERKLREFMETYKKPNEYNFKVMSGDYMTCLKKIPQGSLVYADPPYCFVHYSRFYHAIETLVKYDYPVVEHKGRYRQDRHQSPFCISTKVTEAFSDMFSRIREKDGQMVLSYCNTGMIDIDVLIALAKNSFGKSYKIVVKHIDYKHSTMGRKNDKSRDVQESLVIAKRR